MRSAHFWDFTMQRTMVLSYRRFGTTYVPSWRVKQSKKNSTLLICYCPTLELHIAFIVLDVILLRMYFIYLFIWSRWPYIIKCGSETTCLLGLRVQIPLKAWIFVCFVCVYSGLCDGLITPLEESCWVCVCLIACNLETSTGLGPSWAVGLLGCSDTENKVY
jgi:hypothetical protein